MKVAALWEKFEAWGVVMRRSWKSTQATHWPHLKEHFGHLELDDLAPADVTAYRLKRHGQLSRWGTQVRPATVNREVHSLTACLRWGQKNGHTEHHPLRGLESEKEIRPRRKPMTEEQRDAIVRELRAVGHEQAAEILIFLYETGCRPKEVLTLQWPQVEVGKVGGQMMPVALSIEDTKNGDARLVPLTNIARAVLAARATSCRYVFGREGGRYCATTLNRQFRGAKLRAGLSPQLKMYATRHARGTKLRRSGAQWLVIKALLGHRDDRSAQAYQDITPEDLFAATELTERKKSGNETQENGGATEK